MKKTSLSQHVASAGLVVYILAKAAVRFFGLLPPYLPTRSVLPRGVSATPGLDQQVFKYLPLYQTWVQLSHKAT